MFDSFMAGPATVTTLAEMPAYDPKPVELEHALLAAVGGLERAAKLLDSGTANSSLETGAARVSALAARISKVAARRRAEQIAMTA
jgi:hypothetical protein